jgi:hypothetical protein
VLDSRHFARVGQSARTPGQHKAAREDLLHKGFFVFHAYQRRLNGSVPISQIATIALRPRFSSMKQLYVIMAFGFAASLMVSLWVGISGIQTANMPADEVGSITVGRGK